MNLISTLASDRRHVRLLAMRLCVALTLVAVVLSVSCTTSKKGSSSLSGTVFFRTSFGEVRKQGGIRVALIEDPVAFSARWSDINAAMANVQTAERALVEAKNNLSAAQNSVNAISVEIENRSKEPKYWEDVIDKITDDIEEFRDNEGFVHEAQSRLERAIRERDAARDAVNRDVAPLERKRSEARARASRRDSLRMVADAGRTAALAALQERKSTLEDFIVATSRVTVTGADGDFTFENIKEGSYLVLALAQLGEDVAAWMQNVQIGGGDKTCDLHNEQCQILEGTYAEPLQRALQTVEL